MGGGWSIALGGAAPAGEEAVAKGEDDCLQSVLRSLPPLQARNCSPCDDACMVAPAREEAEDQHVLLFLPPHAIHFTPLVASCQKHYPDGF